MKVSAGICAYNEGKSIAGALRALLPQLGSGDELIVVASGCTDGTIPIVRGFAEKDARVKLVVEAERRGKASALNRILGLAKGGFLVLSDADVVVSENAVQEILKPFADEKVGAVIGRTESFQLVSCWDGLQDFAWRAFNELRRKQSETGELFALNGYLSAVRTGLAQRIPENSLVEDWALGWAIKQKGYHILFCEPAVVRVKAAQNLADYLRQKIRVRVGQLQIRASGMKASYLRQPGNLGLLLKSPYALPYLLLDLVAWVGALYRYRTGTLKWSPVASSKP